MAVNTIHATYRIVTPMFCGGADPTTQVELRLPSLKGALRFWWRTLMWRDVQDVAELCRREADIFGSSDSRFGQSRIRMCLEDVNLCSKVEKGKQFEGGKLQGAHYLGYGVMEAFASRIRDPQAGQLTRPMIPGGTFTLACRMASSLDERQIRQIQKALILLGTVGGLGSKSRKGFGSLTLASLSGDGVMVVPNTPEERLKAILTDLTDPQPEWTAWSKHCRIVTIHSGMCRAVDLLDKLGREQVYYRSWGNNGKVMGLDREGNFKDDHDLSKGQNVAIQHPKRIVFGLPHNYGKSSGNMTVEPSELDRRASPLFLHIHQIDEQSPPVGIAAFLPARFLPEGENIKAFGRKVPLDTSNDFWQPVHGYLDRLIGADGATRLKTDLQGNEVHLG